MKNRHSFHLVSESPWPLFTSVAALFLPISIVLYMQAYINSFAFLLVAILCVAMFIILWVRDIVREGTFLGSHTSVVQVGLRYGMALFIVSEVMFFFSFFWAFLHCGWVPNVEIQGCWPPIGVSYPNTFGIPFMNTLILLWSGAMITWAHNCIILDKDKETAVALTFTIILALFFTFMQGVEYYYAPFSIADNVAGATFYMATGFHGFHVIIGTVMISVSLYRVLEGHFTPKHHFGFECAAWYWHFVDVVWLLLFLIFYVWGSFDRIEETYSVWNLFTGLQSN